MKIIPGWSTPSMIMYIILGLYAVACIRCVLKKDQIIRHKVSFWNIYYVSVIIIWDIVASFRYICGDEIGGRDSEGYIYYFENCLNRDSEHFEILYQLINKAIRLVFDNYHVFFLICYGFIIFSFLLFVDEFMMSRTSTIPFVLLIFELWRGFNTFRTTFAVAFILCGLVLYKRGKKIAAVIFSIFGVLVHTAVAVYLLFIPFHYMYKKKKIKLWHGLLVSGLFYILARLFQRFLLTAGLPLLNLIDTGAVQGYISGTLNQSIFQFNLINLEHGLLFVVLLMFWKSIKKSISERNPDEQRKLNLLLLICYFDFLTIPINFVLGVWRGYEVFYVPRLVMWGELIGIVRGKFARGSRWMVTVVFAILFVGWMVFRFYSIWEDSGLMPYIFEPISKYIKK